MSSTAYSKYALDEVQSGHYPNLESANGMQPGSDHTARERRWNPIPAVENSALLYRGCRAVLELLDRMYALAKVENKVSRQHGQVMTALRNGSTPENCVPMSSAVRR